MYKYRRLTISLNEDKIKEKYTSLLEKLRKKCNKEKACNNCDISYNILCIKEKWDINITEWEQGFDSDCYGHCCQTDICFKIFEDDECHNEDSLKSVVVEFENRVRGSEEHIEE